MPKPTITSCQKFSEQLVRYGFNELSFWRRRKLKSHLRQCADCSAVLQQYKHLSGGFDDLERQRLPELALQRVMLRSLEAESTPRFHMPNSVARKWGVIVVGALALLAAAVIWQSTDLDRHQQYSHKEIQSAKTEIEAALGVVGRIMNRTQGTLAKETSADRIVKPIWQGLEIALKPLMNGG